MKKIWQTSSSSSLLLLVILLMLVVAGVGLYYYYYFGPTTTTTAAEESTATSVQNSDFQLQASVDKTEYKYGEPVTVSFKITYLGKSPVTVNMPWGLPGVIAVKNATESWSIRYKNAIAYMSSYNFTPGQYIAGATVITTGGDIQYRSDGGGTAPLISDKPFSGFSPGGSYYIQVKTNYLNATDPIFGPEEAELTTSPLHITIKPR